MKSSVWKSCSPAANATVDADRKLTHGQFCIDANKQTRSFCYVDDLIEGFIRFMDLPRAEDGGPGFPGPINLGNPNEFTIRQLAEAVIQITGAKSSIVFRPLPTDDPLQRQSNISRAQSLLGGWEPQVQLLEGLTKTCAHFDKLLSQQNAQGSGS